MTNSRNVISFNIPFMEKGNVGTKKECWRFLQKGGTAMNLNVTFDWKLAVALGGSVVCIIFAKKMDPNAAERVSIHAIDACKEYAVAYNCNR